MERTSSYRYIVSFLRLYHPHPPESYSLSASTHWQPHSVVEVTIGVICGSVPNLPALFRLLAPSLSCITEPLLGLLCGSRSKKSYELPRHILGGCDSRPKTPWRRQVETHVLASNQGLVCHLFVTCWSVPYSMEHAKCELEKEDMSEAPGILSLSQSTRRAPVFLEMSARQGAMITTCPSTQKIPSLPTKHPNHPREIWKA